MIKENLKKLRLAHKLSQKELAENLGMSVQRYNHYETGKREPNQETLQKIADFYQVPIKDMFEDINVLRNAHTLSLSEENQKILTRVAEASGMSESEILSKIFAAIFDKTVIPSDTEIEQTIKAFLEISNEELDRITHEGKDLTK